MSWYAVSEIGAFSPLRLNHLNPNPGDSKGFSASEGRYGLVDKTHPSCVRPGLNTRVQH